MPRPGTTLGGEGQLIGKISGDLVQLIKKKHGYGEVSDGVLIKSEEKVVVIKLGVQDVRKRLQYIFGTNILNYIGRIDPSALNNNQNNRRSTKFGLKLIREVTPGLETYIQEKLEVSDDPHKQGNINVSDLNPANMKYVDPNLFIFKLMVTEIDSNITDTDVRKGYVSFIEYVLLDGGNENVNPVLDDLFRVLRGQPQTPGAPYEASDWELVSNTQRVLFDRFPTYLLKHPYDWIPNKGLRFSTI
ncbi:uncharacterized protein LOC113281028 isoform X2 [Papaver somniferum]|uniref:uncharacterized protein LOC113281028 isoform X2 n=1 Tax=Papaver somniferum TaxID=3469 RepID=UPI000E6FE141|nr:uncharacterized protein LOC113281028 isoform X2 [Papaver somniferum]